ncbi:MAG TPA: DeoR/GlpR family DNA-binding transcription regulator [Trueperaceae bacterium]|nr:DeoR/GlpR family DNA-binding transcription regulator [Trueperaceae bacterium]
MDTSSAAGRSRLQRLHDLILQRGELKVDAIAELLDVSIATVRRDLAALERRGVIERVWGGAKVRSPITYLQDFREAAEQEAVAKRAIAAAASAGVEKGMVVGLSGGTTCTELARWLRGKPITVVTNAINVATELYNHSLTKVIVTGGVLNSYSYELIGEMVNFTLQEYRLDLCFLGCSGVAPDFGFSMRDHLESAMARAFLAVSERAVVVADHSKVGRKTLAKFAPLSAIDRLITDESLSAEWREQLEHAGLCVELAPGLEEEVG